MPNDPLVDQLVEYIEWASRIIPGSHRDMTKGILVGRDFAYRVDKRDGVVRATQRARPLYQFEGVC